MGRCGQMWANREIWGDGVTPERADEALWKRVRSKQHVENFRSRTPSPVPPMPSIVRPWRDAPRGCPPCHARWLKPVDEKFEFAR